MTHNFLSFDIEEWYNANFTSLKVKDDYTINSKLEYNVDKLIDICAEYDVKSTCFVLGKIAKDKPNVVKKLHRAGHEIACHSFNHKLIYTMTSEEFMIDTKMACEELQNIIGEKVIGYRAPSWSVNENVVDWFWDILEDNGILYSSSVYPAKTYLYGLPGFAQKIDFPVINGVRKNVLEIPQTLINVVGKQIGFSGGFYLRVFPSWFINMNIKSLNRNGRNVFVYLHPHEIDRNLPKADMSFLENLILKWNIRNTEKKTKKIVSKNKASFIKMGEFVNLKS